jgi:hypothetical protein
LDTSTEIFFEVNSIADFKSGRKLFADNKELIAKGHTYATIKALGVLEAGTEKGKTSVMFLLEDPRGDFTIAQIPYSVFKVLFTLAQNANLSFTKDDKLKTSELN